MQKITVTWNINNFYNVLLLTWNIVSNWNCSNEVMTSWTKFSIYNLTCVPFSFKALYCRYCNVFTITIQITVSKTRNENQWQMRCKQNSIFLLSIEKCDKYFFLLFLSTIIDSRIIFTAYTWTELWKCEEPTRRTISYNNSHMNSAFGIWDT